jgi:hypothetical protein
MNLTERLHKLNAKRSDLITRCNRKSRDHKSTAADQRDLVRTTCKVLKFELRQEKAK